MYETQKQRIEAVKQIGFIENKNVYEETTKLIRDKDRRSLDNLIDVNLVSHINSRNPVVVAFINAITAKQTESGIGLIGNSESVKIELNV